MDADRSFADFVRTRDPARLGEVFDACADDLFGLALHLCSDRAAAEDALQATFLVAIERAGRWDASRPLRPWLLGILHREAARSRRRARRSVDEGRVTRPAAPPSPPQRVLAAETTRAVEDALDGLPEPYRAVVELHVVHALQPAAIAERLQRSPGAVRTQLWRGLDLLRRLLPPGLGVALAPQLTANAPLTAVRARVLDAAAAATKTTATAATVGAVLLGGLAMKKLLLGAAVLAAALVAWNLHVDTAPQSPPAPPSGNASAAGVVAGSEVTRDASPTDVGALRTPVQPEAGPAEPPPAVTVAVPLPVVLPVVVVDRDGRVVRDAEVTVFACATRDENGTEHATDRRAGTAALAVRRTDDTGRTHVTVAGDCLVGALHPRLGCSGDSRLQPGARTLPAELRLVLQPTAIVRGVLLAADGATVAGVRVECHQQLHWHGITGEAPPAVTDDDGRFTLRVAAGEPGSVRANRGARWATAQVPKLAPGAEHELALRFPGAFAVRGTLTDADGRPLQGRVRLFALVDGRGERHVAATTDAKGRFELLLTQGGRYVVLGGAERQTSARIDVELDAARPHAEIVLRTAPFVPVDGLVLDERGEPVAGCHVGLTYVVVREAVHEQRSELHGVLPRGPTDAKGRFRFEVPAGYRYQVVAQVIAGNRDLWVRSGELDVPATGVRLVVRDADKQGFVVHGRVVAARDGAPVPGARIGRQTLQQDGGASSGDAGQAGGDGAFRLGPFRTGQRYAFAFEAEGFARTIVGPFDATVRDEELTVRMPRCGSVQVRVLRADGTPAAGAFANLQARVHDPFVRAWQGEVDANGSITFGAVPPGPYKVHARATLATKDVTTVETVVHAEQTSAAQIVLPK